MPDARYTAELEYCGHAEPRLVVRFCGEWLGVADGPTDAEAMANQHNQTITG